MKKIFYVMGKSATGKDTIFRKLTEQFPEMGTVIPYTTRPIRNGEKKGVEYFFTTEAELYEMEQLGKVIEKRTYQTTQGPWSYATVNDGQIDLRRRDYLMIGTLESYDCVKRYFGEESVIPIYIEVEDGERLTRALEREKQQSQPKYAELCRRYLADEKDFSDEMILKAGITARYDNTDGTACEIIAAQLKAKCAAF